MELQTIGMVSKKFNISTRTLRYYEQMGLLKSVKKDGDAYRTYDEDSLKIIDSLTITKIDFKEELTMNDLNKANEKLSKLTDIRIVYLPPTTVASVHFYCDEPERHAVEVMDKFVRENNLFSLKPDLRHYGFNNPDPSPNTPEGMPDQGYEIWVTIPDDMIVPEPLTKKHFEGGLYAAHMIKMGNFHEWEWLIQWVLNNDIYEANWGTPQGTCGLLEEHLNYINHVNLPNSEPSDMQLDLLMPIKLKEK